MAKKVVYLLQILVLRMKVLRLHVKALQENVLIQKQLIPQQCVVKELALIIKLLQLIRIVSSTYQAVEQMGLVVLKIQNHVQNIVEIKVNVMALSEVITLNDAGIFQPLKPQLVLRSYVLIILVLRVTMNVVFF